MECPKCQNSEMWDNRFDKKNPKGPDFKCKDPACAHAIWIEKKKPVAKQAAGPGMPAVEPRPIAERPARWTWPTLSETYLQSLLIARKQVVGLATSLKLEVRLEDILSAAHTVFIAASRDGVKLIAQSREPEEETADV